MQNYYSSYFFPDKNSNNTVKLPTKEAEEVFSSLGQKFDLSKNPELALLNFDEIKDHEDRYNDVLERWIKKNIKVDHIEFDKKDQNDMKIKFNNQLVKIKKIEELCEKVYISGDIHGDMDSFLFPLIHFGFMNIDPVEPFIFVDPETGERTNNLISHKNLIKIPQLNLIGEKFASGEKLIYLGDYLDRGEHAIEVIYLVVDIINQLKEQTKENDLWPITFILGNHELMIIKNRFHYFYQHLFSYDPNKRARFFSLKTNPQNLQKLLIEKIVDKGILFSKSINGIFFSHSYICPYLIDDILHQLESKKDQSPFYPHILNLYESNDKIIDGKINQKSFFKSLDIDLGNVLSVYIHESSYSHMEELGSRKRNTSNFDRYVEIMDHDFALNNDYGLTWSRMYYVKDQDTKEDFYDPDYAPLLSLQMISGHQGLMGGVPENYGFSEYHLCLDVCQSHAFYEDNVPRPSVFLLKNFKLTQFKIDFSAKS